MSVPTAEELREVVATLGKASGRDAEDLLECSIEELATLAVAYRDAAAPAEATWWDRALVVLGYVAAAANPLGTVASALATVFGAAGAAKTL